MMRQVWCSKIEGSFDRRGKWTDEKKKKLIKVRDKMAAELNDKQYVDFVHILFDKGFFNNISQDDIAWNTADGHEMSFVLEF